MKQINKLLILVLSLLLLSHASFASGGKRTGTGGATQLLIPVGARTMAMGGANISSVHGIEALFWNPAGIAITDHSVDVTFSHMTYLADIGVEYGAVSAKIEGFGVLSFNVKTLAIGDIPITTTRDPDGTGSTFRPQMLTFGLGYSRALTDNIAVGVIGTFISETIGDVDATGMAFSIGIMYENLGAINGLNFGVTVKNLGPEMRYDGPGLLYESSVTEFNRPPQLAKYESAAFELPSQFELGFSYQPKFDAVNNVIFTSSFQNNNFSGDEYRFGAEYNYTHQFFVRGGYQFAPDVNSEDYIFGLSAGVGVKYNTGGIDLMVDYAFKQVEYFDNNHVFSVTLGF